MGRYGVYGWLAAGALAAALAGCGKASGAGGASTAASGGGAPGPVTLSAIPHRKPGLWRMSFTSAQTLNTMPATEICVDEASEARMSAITVSGAHSDCTPSLTRNLDGSITFSSTCPLQGGAGGTVTAKGTLSGSFDSAYKMDMETTTTGASVPGGNGTRKMTMSGTYIGSCPAGQHGGDMTMTLPDGRKMTMPSGMSAGQ